ncbi:hypothetical protein DVH05_012402 [Phytophthora capsici]|nr:hypothetical protein DVH05_012402 [Phytophthora capsici]
MKSTEGTGSKQRAIKGRPERSGYGIFTAKKSSTAVSHNNLNTTSAASQAGPKPARDVDGSKRLAEYARAAHARAAKRIKMHHRHAVRAIRVAQAAHARNAKATACQRNDNCPQESETTGGNPIA